MGRKFVDFFGILAKFPEVGPKSLKDLPELEDSYLEAGKPEMADWLRQWRERLEYHIRREFEK